MEEWKPIKLKWIFDQRKNGIWGDEAKGDENDIFCLRVADFDYLRLNINERNLTLRNISENFIKDRLLKKGDILLEKSGGGELQPVGRAVIFDKDFKAVSSNFIEKLSPRSGFNSRYIIYLFYHVYKNRQNLPFIKQTTGIQNFDSESFLHSSFFIPSFKTQFSIANYLDKKTSQLDTLITNKQKLIELLKEERMAVINDAVSGKGKNWGKKKLKYLAILRDELIDDSDFKIAVENIEGGTGKLINMEAEKNYQGQLCAFKIGDTILNKLRPYLHKVYFATKDGGLFGELLILKSIGEIIPKFLYYKLFSKEFIDVVDSSTQGTKMPRANWNDFICQLFISFPRNKAEQTAIVHYIDVETQRIDNTISNIEKEKKMFQEYRVALISEVVTGKVKVV